MVYGDLQFFDIIIFAAIAAFIIYRLRGVLGKRTGFQKKPTDQQFVKEQPAQKKEEVLPDEIPPDLVLETTETEAEGIVEQTSLALALTGTMIYGSKTSFSFISKKN